MENFLQKLSSKLSKLSKLNKFWIDEWERFKKVTKLFFLPLTVHPKLWNKHKEKMYFLMDKNHHYGFLIETILIKLKLMKESWPDYKNNTNELEILNSLIHQAEDLLELLEHEDLESHVRSSNYLIKQKQFFTQLSNQMTELFY